MLLESELMRFLPLRLSRCLYCKGRQGLRQERKGFGVRQLATEDQPPGRSHRSSVSYFLAAPLAARFFFAGPFWLRFAAI